MSLPFFGFGEDDYRRLIRGESRSLGAFVARGSLGVVSHVYGVVAALRNHAFDRGWKTSHRVGIPVVSVGNLTLGGTGKTPMVEWVARWFRARGVRVAILSRGYGQSTGLNDEGRVLEDNLPDVPHLQGVDRVALARTAVEELEAEVLVLDDGFQHRRLARDLDLVLLDALDPFGTGHVFPRGLLREPTGSLRRAGVVILSKADLIPESARAAIRTEAERRAGPVHWAEARHAPQTLMNAEGQTLTFTSAQDARVAAFCGIGNPEGFRRTLEGMGLNIQGFRAFPDHHPYRRDDVSSLASWASGLGADLALTTQKDFVKLRTLALGSVPLYALRIGLEILVGADVLEEALMDLSPGER